MDDMHTKRATIADASSMSRSTTMGSISAEDKPTPPPKRPPKPGQILTATVEVEETSGGKWKRGAEAEAIMALLRAEASKTRPTARTVEVKAPPPTVSEPPVVKPPRPPVTRKASAPPIPLKPIIPPKPTLSVSSPADASPKRSMKGISSTDVVPVTDTNPEGKWKRSAEAEALLSMLQAEASQDAIEELIKSKIEAEPAKAPEPEPEKKATDPFEELLMTERNFVYDLDNVLNTFVKPLREKEVISSSLVDEFSLNFDCLADFHKHLYGKICKEQTVSNLVDCFNPEALVELEKLYTVYMGNYERILALFYEKRDSNAGLRKFLKAREETSSKSVNNLLVTPMQRVCKYELMLASIVKMKQKAVSKGELEKGENAKSLLADCEMLQTRVEEIGAVLQNVDRRRQAADIWENIMQLEQSLLVSEPLAKVGRHIIKQEDVPMKAFGSASTHGSVDTFKLVLFNDLLVRTKVPKKGKKGRVLDQCLPSSFQLIDAGALAHLRTVSSVTCAAVGHPNSREVPMPQRLYIVDLDPRGSIFELHTSNITEKDAWIESLRSLAQTPAKFWAQWDIEEVAPDGHKETLLAADSCEWAQAFVKQCRIFITSSYLCLLWKVYGRVERTKVPLSMITVPTKEKKSATSKTGTIEVKTNTWKQSYRFTDVQNCDYTFAMLEDALMEFKASERLSLASSGRADRRGRHAGPGAFSSLLMPLDDWAAIWEHAQKQIFKKGQTVVAVGNANPMLFQVLSGQVASIEDSSHTIGEGGLFGLQSFLQGTPSTRGFVCATPSLQVRVFDRKSFSRHVKDPQVQARFFALLAFKQAA